MREEKRAEAISEEIIAENIPRTSGSSKKLKEDKHKRNHTLLYPSRMLKIKDKEKNSSEEEPTKEQR